MEQKKSQDGVPTYHSHSLWSSSSKNNIRKLKRHQEKKNKKNLQERYDYLRCSSLDSSSSSSVSSEVQKLLLCESRTKTKQSTRKTIPHRTKNEKKKKGKFQSRRNLEKLVIKPSIFSVLSSMKLKTSNPRNIKKPPKWLQAQVNFQVSFHSNLYKKNASIHVIWSVN